MRSTPGGAKDSMPMKAFAVTLSVSGWPVDARSPLGKEMKRPVTASKPRRVNRFVIVDRAVPLPEASWNLLIEAMEVQGVAYIVVYIQ